MALADLTVDSVRRAVDEFDRLGRDAFLRTYGFRKATKYLLVENGQSYDSKAIAGVAHQYLPGNNQLSAGKFSGGENAAAKKLGELGFTIRGPNDQLLAVPTYEPGSVYNRVRDIHEIYGGQRQGGISTPQRAPLIFLFTGESGDQYGYGHDGPKDDGTFAYTGEGQVGDMRFIAGNRYVRDHVASGRDVLLFQKLRRSGHYRFLGNYACDGYEYRQGPDRNGDQRRVIVFHLRPAARGEEPEVEAAADELHSRAIEELRRRAIEDATAEPDRKEGRRTYIQRSASVRAYVLRRANGICECCDEPAPFVRSNGEPYLEPHHTRRLADGGPDHPRWVGVVCPTCHREIHHGMEGHQRNEKLQTRLDEIENRRFPVERSEAATSRND